MSQPDPPDHPLAILPPRVRVAVAVFTYVGIPTGLLGVILGFATGWLPFTVCEPYRAHQMTVVERQRFEQERKDLDANTLKALRQITENLTQINLRNHIMDCSRIASPPERQECLRVVLRKPDGSS